MKSYHSKNDQYTCYQIWQSIGCLVRRFHYQRILLDSTSHHRRVVYQILNNKLRLTNEELITYEYRVSFLHAKFLHIERKDLDIDKRQILNLHSYFRKFHQISVYLIVNFDVFHLEMLLLTLHHSYFL